MDMNPGSIGEPYSQALTLLISIIFIFLGKIILSIELYFMLSVSIAPPILELLKNNC